MPLQYVKIRSFHIPSLPLRSRQNGKILQHYFMGTFFIYFKFLFRQVDNTQLFKWIREKNKGKLEQVSLYLLNVLRVAPPCSYGWSQWWARLKNSIFFSVREKKQSVSALFFLLKMHKIFYTNCHQTGRWCFIFCLRRESNSRVNSKHHMKINSCTAVFNYQ